MNKSTEDILATYVKVDESEHLANTMQDDRDKLELVLALIAENGRTTTDHKRYKIAKKTVFKKYCLQYEYNEEETAPAGNTEPLAWWEVQDDDDDNEEEEVEEDAEEDDDDEEEEVVDDRDDDMEEDTL